MGSACRYSISMRTGKPAFDLVKAVVAGKPVVPPSRRNKTSPHCADAMMLAELLQQSDDGRSLRDFIQANCPTPPALDSEIPLAPRESIQHQGERMELDLTPLGSSYPYSAMDTTQIGNTGVESGENIAWSAQLTESSDGLYTSAQKMSAGVDSYPHSPDISLSATLPMDFEYFQFDLLGPETPQRKEAQSPIRIQDENDSIMPIDPAIQQPLAPRRQHCCIRTAKAIQQSITLMTGGDETSQGEHYLNGSTSPIRTTDQALLMCSTVGQQIMEILRCRCESDAHLPFLLTVLISKILAIYGAIAKVGDCGPFNFRIPPQQQTQKQPGGDAFEAVPLRLGSYDVDRELEGVLRAHMVLHELSKLGCLCKLFAEKYCQGEEDNKSSLDGIIYSALNNFIGVRFAATKAACELRSALAKSATQT